MDSSGRHDNFLDSFTTQRHTEKSEYGYAYTNATKNLVPHSKYGQKKLAGYTVLCTKLLLDMDTIT